MAEHKHGEMDTADQERVFAGFIKGITWSVVVILAVLIFTAMVNS